MDDAMNGSEKTDAARLLLSEGKTTNEVRAEILRAYGEGIGAGTLTELRRDLGLPPGPSTGARHGKKGRKGNPNIAALGAMGGAARQASAPTATERKAEAERLLRQGLTGDAIRAAVEEKFGHAVSFGTIALLRRRLEREAKRAAKAAAKASAPAVVAAPTPSNWVRLPASPEVVMSLVTAAVPFVFDGKTVSMKGGAR